MNVLNIRMPLLKDLKDLKAWKVTSHVPGENTMPGSQALME